MMSLKGDEELSFAKEYLKTMFKMLRSETPENAWMYLRAIQELEEFADKNGKTISIEVKLVPN